MLKVSVATQSAFEDTQELLTEILCKQRNTTHCDKDPAFGLTAGKAFVLSLS